MLMAVLAWVVAIPVLGGVTGLRSMTPMAVLCWFAYRGHLSVGGTWGQWTTKPVTVIVFVVLAVGELIGDKLPKTPNRTAPLPLFARVLLRRPGRRPGCDGTAGFGNRRVAFRCDRRGCGHLSGVSSAPQFGERTWASRPGGGLGGGRTCRRIVLFGHGNHHRLIVGRRWKCVWISWE